MTTNPMITAFVPHGDYVPLTQLPSSAMDNIEAWITAVAAKLQFVTARAHLVADGATDIGPAIQAAYDAGDRVISLDPKGDYYWNTPVFVDDTDPEDQGLTIYGNHARIILGSALPTTSVSGVSAFSGTRFAIFPNTLRTAHNTGTNVVTISDATRATGSGGALRSLVIYDALFDGQSANRGISYANRAAASFFGVKLDDARVALTWFSYTDGNLVVGGWNRGSGYAGQVYIEQVDQGDGLVIIAPKSDSSIVFAKLALCRGASITGPVTCRMEFDDCSNVKIDGGHQEGQQSDSTVLALTNTDLTYHGSIYQNGTQPAITIVDSGGTPGSYLRLIDVQSVSLFTSGDTPRAPLLSITPNHSTQVKVRRLRGVVASSAMAGEHTDSIMPWITGSAGIISAAATPAAQYAQASGSWDLRATTSSTAFVLQRPEGFVVTKREPAQPVLTQITTDSGVNTGGTLTDGQLYEYTYAVLDARGKFSQRATAVSATVGAKRGTRLLLELPNGPSVVKIWRKAGTGVTTAPGHSIIVFVNARRPYLLDTGAYLNGMAWAVASDAADTVAGTNQTLDGIVLGTGFLYVEAGVAKFLGGSGTVTTLAPA